MKMIKFAAVFVLFFIATALALPTYNEDTEEHVRLERAALADPTHRKRDPLHHKHRPERPLRKHHRLHHKYDNYPPAVPSNGQAVAIAHATVITDGGKAEAIATSYANK